MNVALLLIDIQNDYFEGGANPLVGSSEAARKAGSILNYFREHQLPVVHVQHEATRADATFFLPNTEGVKLHSLVEPKGDEVIVVKHFPNSFRGTNLLEVLKSKGIDTLVIGGMMTQMCVDTTVRAAKDLGFECIVASDACATRDMAYGGAVVAAKDVQVSFMAALSYFFARVVTADECLRLL
jgi:nicotinamidase-related amidase